MPEASSQRTAGRAIPAWVRRPGIVGRPMERSMTEDLLNIGLLAGNACFGCGHENPDGLRITGVAEIPKNWVDWLADDGT